jgi:hypothetical protein|tara:strand:+ start:1003 stop:1677 length:675 start_codon:yes stop_codon:yes gene_type:complete
MYFPKNKIITNLYTAGSVTSSPLTDIENDTPLINTETGEVYIGYYWKDYQGRFYTGKTPNDSPTIPLILQKPPEKTTPQNPQHIPLSQYYSPQEGVDYNPSMLYEYTTSNNINIEVLKTIPTQSYPTPTENDYKVGNFKRYFCVKANENSYLELDKKTHDKLSSKNSNWAYELYIPFYITWYITGEESQVESTNKNLVIIYEQRSNRKGFKEFLRENYTKYYTP